MSFSFNRPPAPIDKGKVGGKTADASTVTAIHKSIVIGNTSQSKIGLPVKFSGNTNAPATISNNAIVKTLKGGSPRTFGIDDPNSPEVQARLWTELNYSPLPYQVVEAFSGLSFYIVLIDQKTPTSYFTNMDGENYSTYYNPDTDNKLYWGKWAGPVDPPAEYLYPMENTDFEDGTKIIFTSMEKITLKEFAPGTNRKDILDELNARFADAGVASVSGEYGDMRWYGGDYTRLRARLNPEGNFILLIEGSWYDSLYLRPGPNAYVGLFFGGGPTNKKSGSTLFGVTTVEAGACGVDSAALLMPPGGSSITTRGIFAPVSGAISSMPIYECPTIYSIDDSNFMTALSGRSFYVFLAEARTTIPLEAETSFLGLLKETIIYNRNNDNNLIVSRQRVDLTGLNVMFQRSPVELINYDINPDPSSTTNRLREVKKIFLTFYKGFKTFRNFTSEEPITDVIRELNLHLSTVDVTPSGTSGPQSGSGPSRLVASLTPDRRLQLTIEGSWYSDVKTGDQPRAYVGLFFGDGPSKNGNPSTSLGVTNIHGGWGVDSAALLIPSGSISVTSQYQIASPLVNFTVRPGLSLSPGGGTANNAVNINNQPLSNGALRALSGARFFYFYCGFEPTISTTGLQPYTAYYNPSSDDLRLLRHWPTPGAIINGVYTTAGFFPTSTTPYLTGNGFLAQTYDGVLETSVRQFIWDYITLPVFPMGSTRQYVVEKINLELAKLKFGISDGMTPGSGPVGDGPSLVADLTSEGKLRLTIPGQWYATNTWGRSWAIPSIGLLFTGFPEAGYRNGATALGVTNFGQIDGWPGKALLIQAGSRTVTAKFIVGDNTIFGSL